MNKINQITNNAIQIVTDNNKADFDRILLFAEDWVKTQFKEFSNETLKSCYYKLGNPAPAQVNVYGAVIRNLSRRKLIFKHGTTNGTTEQSHGSLRQTWISKEFRLKQSNNRKQDVTLDMFKSV